MNVMVTENLLLLEGFPLLNVILPEMCLLLLKSILLICASDVQARLCHLC
jgi:hypothetical protein